MVAKKKANDTEAALATLPAKVPVAMTRNGLVPTNIDDGYRFAKMISRSQMVPEAYQGNPDNCLVAIDLALRWRVSWLVVMQHVYMVHNRPALDAALCIALTNASGIFEGPIEYEVVGDDPHKDDYKVRAYAVRKSTGQILKGPWIDWRLVKGEGWDKKQGSKWMTMPGQMFHYRAAVWFQRRYAPEVAMGMITTDEAADMEAEHVESTVVGKGVDKLKERLQEREEATQETTEQPNDPAPDTEQANAEDRPTEPVDEEQAGDEDTASIFD